MIIVPFPFNEVVRKLSNLSIVDPNDLRFLADSKREPGDEVHGEEDDTGHSEGVGETGDCVGELMQDLDPVMVDPAAGDFCDTVQCRDVICCKDAPTVSLIELGPGT